MMSKVDQLKRQIAQAKTDFEEVTKELKASGFDTVEALDARIKELSDNITRAKQDLTTKRQKLESEAGEVLDALYEATHSEDE